ncbi:hypothetical protein SUDANB99_02072 [Streptomyces sp. enrichment culture]
MRIIHALLRGLLELIAPASGRRRADSSRAATPKTPCPAQWRTAHIPRPRSPYGLNHPLDGDASPLVRPYLLAHELEQTQAWRRLTLLLAADFGIDLDTRVLHTAGAAR